MAKTFQIRERATDDFDKIKVLCIGAGVSGILSGIKLPQKIENLELAIYEKSADIGGTWLDNHYPGSELHPALVKILKDMKLTKTQLHVVRNSVNQMRFC